MKVVEIIRDILHQFIKKFFDTVPSSLATAIKYHTNIYEAIKQHNPEAARNHMEGHIMYLIEITKEELNW